jgi:hypothetical protein
MLPKRNRLPTKRGSIETHTARVGDPERTEFQALDTFAICSTHHGCHVG